MDCSTIAGAISSLTAGVLVIDESGTIAFANPAAMAILRRPIVDLLGAPLSDVLVKPEELPTSSSSQLEREIVLPDGSKTVVGFSTSVVSPAGCRSILFQEITHVLALRRERDRLLQMATLGDALPSILHELRNPLAAVTNSLEVLIEESNEEMQHELHAILWEVRRMSLTLQGVGGFARPVHADRHSSADLAVSEACRILEPNAHRRGIGLDVVVPTMPLLPLDWGVLSGVVFNLVKNAIDACNAGDSIVVGAALESDQTFVLRVSDTGAGMPKEVQARCRELFFTSKEKGSGIGLALCHQIAESSGGRLDIESTVGVGTVVTLSLPLMSPS
jgi:two-component system sensor histidine kinase AtoS